MEKPFLFIEIGADDHNLTRDRTTLRHPKTLGSLNTANGVPTHEVFRERDPSTGRIEEASQHRIKDKRTLHQIREAQHRIRTSQGIEVGDQIIQEAISVTFADSTAISRGNAISAQSLTG